MIFMQEQMERLMKVVEDSKMGDSYKLAPGSKLSIMLPACHRKIVPAKNVLGGSNLLEYRSLGTIFPEKSDPHMEN